MSLPLNGANMITMALNSGGLAIGSTTSQFSTGATLNYSINGRIYSKAATASQAFVIEPNSGIVPTALNTLQTLPAGRSCSFAVLLDAAGNFTVAQGDIVDNGLATPVARPPAGKAIVGAIKIANATNPFIPGTTALTATGVTATYVNLTQHTGAAI